MPSISSSDVVVATTAMNLNFNIGVKNMSIVDITFGDGSLTYPTGGIPLPAFSNFGFRNAIDFFASEGTPDNGYCFRYDRDNHKLLIYSGGTEAADTVTPAEQTVRSLIVGT